MTELEIYLQPPDFDVINFERKTSESHIGNIIKHFNGTEQEKCVYNEDLKGFDLALIGVTEERGSLQNEGVNTAPDNIRKYLYSLFSHWKNLKLVDMGNIKKGNNIEDTYFALSEVVSELIKIRTIPVILGGSQDLTFANYFAYRNLKRIVNITSVDSRFDLGTSEEDVNTHSWLSKIILHQPNFLFNFTNIGYQTYLVNKESIQLMKELFFDAYRLGEVRSNLGLTP
jgi:arginase family enzyme